MTIESPNGNSGQLETPQVAHRESAKTQWGDKFPMRGLINIVSRWHKGKENASDRRPEKFRKHGEEG